MNYRQIDKDRNQLPIERHKRSILYLLEKHRILIVVGETGSGKSTKIPQILFSAGLFNDDNNHSIICITQPRRVAAMQLANRVSQDLNCTLGTTVGYAVRFKDVTHEKHTMIKFMTEGLLLREIMFDPLLKKYSVVMVDEVHERNLNTDILLGLLKCIMLKREDLRIVICSATLNINEISKFFTYSEVYTKQDKRLDGPGVLCVEGKTYPIQIFYRNEPVPNYMDATVDTIIRIHESSRLASGKILAFLTGQDEVDYVCDKLSDYSNSNMTRLDLKKLVALPLHASLKAEQISRVFEVYPRDTRLCIVSTNVAETSLTIDDVAFVIDCGFTKLKIFNHQTGIDSLVRVPVSKSSAKQRAGRAGRTRNGVVYRLYSEEQYGRLQETTVPEIQRTSLAETVMLLKDLGVENPLRFPLISPMQRDNLSVSLKLLSALQAIDETGQLTEIGSMMAQFNLDPKLAKILVSPTSMHCTSEVCKIVAMLQVKEIFVKQGKYTNSMWTNTNLINVCVSEGDLPSYLNIFNAFLSCDKSQKWAERRNLNYQALMGAVEIAFKLESQLKKMGIQLNSCNGRLQPLCKSLVSGLFSNAAYLHPSGDYLTFKGEQKVYIHPTSVFSELLERPKYVVFVEILNTTKSYMRHILAIDSDKWLLEAAPHYYTFSTIKNF